MLVSTWESGLGFLFFFFFLASPSALLFPGVIWEFSFWCPQQWMTATGFGFWATSMRCNISAAYFIGELFEFKIFYFIFLAMLGLCCCLQAFSSYSKWGLLSSCSAPASYHGGFSCYRAQALGHRLSSHGQGMWDLLRAGIKPMCPALQADSHPLDQQASPFSFQVPT